MEDLPACCSPEARIKFRSVLPEADPDMVIMRNRETKLNYLNPPFWGKAAGVLRNIFKYRV